MEKLSGLRQETRNRGQRCTIGQSCIDTDTARTVTNDVFAIANKINTEAGAGGVHPLSVTLAFNPAVLNLQPGQLDRSDGQVVGQLQQVRAVRNDTVSTESSGGSSPSSRNALSIWRRRWRTVRRWAGRRWAGRRWAALNMDGPRGGAKWEYLVGMISLAVMSGKSIYGAGLNDETELR